MGLLLKLTQTLVLEFRDFWASWPRKVAKADAEKAWKKHVTPEDHEPIREALKWQVPMFEQREPEYRPHAATWIRGRRWEDEPPKPTTTRSPATVTPRAIVPGAAQQRDAVTRIQHLMHQEGKSREEAVRIVGIEQGWIKE